MTPYQRVIARFAPKRTDDLKDGPRSLIGEVGEFEALWIIEDGYPYAGQWAMGMPRGWTDRQARVTPDVWGHVGVWVPECDLEILEMS